jgi:hypothetical protein
VFTTFGNPVNGLQSTCERPTTVEKVTPQGQYMEILGSLEKSNRQSLRGLAFADIKKK